MIATLENELITAIKASTLGPRVKAVDSLPDLDGETLVKRFATEAPAIYVSYAGGAIAQECWTRRFGVAVIARHARGHKEARHGDPTTIGLYELIDACQALLEEKRTANAIWYVKADSELRSELMFKANLYGAVIDVETRIAPEAAFALSTLDAFVRYHADHVLADGPSGPHSIEDVNVPQ